MTRYRLLVVLATFFCAFSQINAQNNQFNLRVRAGDNAVFGAFSSTSIDLRHNFNDSFALRGGAQYSTIGRVAAEMRPEYRYKLDWGCLNALALIHYTNQSSINSVAAGVGVGVTSRVVSATLGYYYRLIRGSGDSIKEPVNYFYELRLSCLPGVENWDLYVRLTNSEMFELERQYYPTYIIEGWWYPQDRLGLSIGICHKPAGMFNMSVDYYQFFGNLGLCYKW